MEKIEKLFYQLDKQVTEISQKQNISYLEAIVEVFKFSDTDYDQIISEYDRQVRRKVYQYLLLKALKDATQSQHQMTPDGIGYTIAFFIQLLTDKLEHVKVLELGLGTGNLLATIIEGIPEENVTLSGIEIDTFYVELASLLADYLQLPINLLHQDALAPIFIDKQDIVVADVPVGYYPNDEIASQYKLARRQGHSFSHYLFIEQSMNLLKQGGYAILILPQHFLENSEADILRKYVAEQTKLRAILNLPETLFKSEQAKKSIVILEKLAPDDLQRPEVILANVPSLKNTQVLTSFFNDIKNELNL